jgi:hypothetical protein
VDYSAADPYRLPGHLVAGDDTPSIQTNMVQPASAFVSEGPAGIDSVFEPTVLANDEVGNAGLTLAGGTLAPLAYNEIGNGGPSGFDSVVQPLVLANDEVGNGSSGTASLSILTSYAASMFVPPPGGGMGAVDAAQASSPDFLTRPAA